VGAVLTGGASQRMGCDKALMVVGGQFLAVTATQALIKAGAAAVVAVGGDIDGLTEAGLTVVPDGQPGEGPLGGIITALGHFANSVAPLVVLSCDLPAVDPENVRAAVNAVATSTLPKVGVPVVDGHRQWMHACWTAATRSSLELAFQHGERSVWRAAETAATSGLRIVEVTGPVPAGFQDVDRPSDLDASGR